MKRNQIEDELTSYVNSCNDMDALTVFNKNFNNAKDKNKFIYAASSIYKRVAITLYSIQLLTVIIVIIAALEGYNIIFFSFVVLILAFIYGLVIKRKYTTFLQMLLDKKIQTMILANEKGDNKNA